MNFKFDFEPPPENQLKIFCCIWQRFEELYAVNSMPMVENESYKATSNERRCSHVMIFLENDFDLNTIFLKKS